MKSPNFVIVTIQSKLANINVGVMTICNSCSGHRPPCLHVSLVLAVATRCVVSIHQEGDLSRQTVAVFTQEVYSSTCLLA